MGIRIRKMKCRYGIKARPVKRWPVWFGILLIVLIFGVIKENTGSIIYAAESGKPDGLENQGISEKQKKTEESEKSGDYAILVYPEGNPENYLKLTAAAGEYDVKKGDSLWSVAQGVYGNGSRWKDISEWNDLDNPDRIFPGQYFILPDREYYLQKPKIQLGKGYYLEDKGAFRFQTPERWALGTCSLDARLSTFAGTDRRTRVLWGVEDNEMGEDAWSESWDEVCIDMKETAETVFGEDFVEISFEKYRVESGNEVYAVRCIFTDKDGERRIVSAAYRFGEKNLMEFIGLAPEDFSPDMGRLTLYTAATYEEYEEERHTGFGERSGEYRGMEIWEYPLLHNPFVLAWEQANGTEWRLKKEVETAAEDFIVDWKEPVLEAVVREALQIEGDIRYHDLLQIEMLEVVESAGYDFCRINDALYETDWETIGSGDALVEDISNFSGLYELRVQIGDITDISSLEKLSVLDELEILTGSQAREIAIPEKLQDLKKCIVEKAPLQDYVDSLDASIWKRTCREQKITTFRRSEAYGD